MNIKILGSGCANCNRLEQNARKAVEELGVEATFEKVTDYVKITSYNVLRTPALVVDEKVVISGRVAKPDEIKKYL